MIKLPTINNRDTKFTRELKTAIIELHKMLKQQRIRGDGATFSVTGSGGGLTGHATKHDTAVAKITDASGIDATEQKWDGSAWVDGVREWDSDTGPGTLANPLGYELAVDDRVVVCRGAGGKWAVVSTSITTPTTPIPAKITSGPSEAGQYVGDLYENGWNQVATSTGVTIVVENSSDMVLPSGQPVWVRWNDVDEYYEGKLEVNPTAGGEETTVEWDSDTIPILVDGWWKYVNSRTLAVVGCSANDSSPGTLDSALEDVAGTYDSAADLLVTAEVVDPSADGTDESVKLRVDDPAGAGININAGKLAVDLDYIETNAIPAMPVYEATASESGGSISAKRVNLDGTLSGTDVSFNVLAE